MGPSFAVSNLANASYDVQEIGLTTASDLSSTRTSRTILLHTYEPIPQTDYQVGKGAVIEASPQSNQVDVAWDHGLALMFGENLIDNAGFDSDLADWTPSDGSAITHRTEDGNGFLSMTADKTGTQAAVKNAHQDVDLGGGQLQYGVRFAAQVRWWVTSGQDPTRVTNAQAWYALRFTGDSGTEYYWDEAMRVWVQTATRNRVFVGGLFTPIGTITGELPESDGDLRVILYEGADARIPTQTAIQRWDWDNVEVSVSTAMDEEAESTRILVVDNDVPDAERTSLPSDNRGFLFGSTATQTYYVRRMTQDADGVVGANGWKVGRYEADEESTGHTLDEALARNELALRSKLGKTLHARLDLREARFYTPARPLVYEEEHYMIASMRQHVLERKVDVLAVRISPEMPDEDDLTTSIVVNEEGGGGGRGSSTIGGGSGIARVASDGTLTGDGTGDSPLSVALPVPSYAAGDAGKVLRVNDDENALLWANLAAAESELPAYAEADAGKVLSVVDPNPNAAGDDPVLRWLTPVDTDTNTQRDAGDGLTLTGNTLAVTRPVPTGGTSGQVLKIDDDGNLSWAADENDNTTYAAGNGLTLTGTTFAVGAGTGITVTANGVAVTHPVPPFTADNAGQVLRVAVANPNVLNPVANLQWVGPLRTLPTDGTTGQIVRIKSNGGLEWVDETDTRYTAGNGLTLTGTAFAVGAGTGITVNANNVAVTRPVPTGGTRGQVLKIGSDGTSLEWATDDAGGGTADGNNYVTAGSYSNGVITLTRQGLSDITISGLPTGGGGGGADGNNYVTGGAYANGVLTLERQGLADITISGLPTGGGGPTYTAGDGIDISSNAISIDLAANSGLEFNVGELTLSRPLPDYGTSGQVLTVNNAADGAVWATPAATGGAPASAYAYRVAPAANANARNV